MSTNNSNTDTHIYNIINNPPKEFTEPCECCGVSEFQLGVKHAEERIIKLLKDDKWHGIYLGIARMGKPASRYHQQDCIGCELIELIKGETKCD